MSITLWLAAVVLILSACTHYIPAHGWATLIDGESGMENWEPGGGGELRDVAARPLT